MKEVRKLFAVLASLSLMTGVVPGKVLAEEMPEEMEEEVAETREEEPVEAISEEEPSEESDEEEPEVKYYILLAEEDNGDMPEQVKTRFVINGEDVEYQPGSTLVAPGSVIMAYPINKGYMVKGFKVIEPITGEVFMDEVVEEAISYTFPMPSHHAKLLYYYGIEMDENLASIVRCKVNGKDAREALSGSEVELVVDDYDYVPGLIQVESVEGEPVEMTESGFIMPHSGVVLHSALKTCLSYEETDGTKVTLQSGEFQELADFTNAGALESGVYAISDEVAIDHLLAINGPVTLVVRDGAHLTVKGIRTNDQVLTIYGQGKQNGIIDSKAEEQGQAGIGGSCRLSYDPISFGDIIINGGIINATGAYQGAGIGTGHHWVSEGSVTINGGTVNAYGGGYSAGIGSGDYFGQTCGDITINGGTVTAVGGSRNKPYYDFGGQWHDSWQGAASIGQAWANNGAPGSVTINGGTVYAKSVCGEAAIGDGYQDPAPHKSQPGTPVAIAGGMKCELTNDLVNYVPASHYSASSRNPGYEWVRLS